MNMLENLVIIGVQAAIFILVVLLLRLLLKKTYKVFVYAMWLVVLLRLCIPIQMENPYGLLNKPEPSQIVESTATGEVSLWDDSYADNTQSEIIPSHKQPTAIKLADQLSSTQAITEAPTTPTDVKPDIKINSRQIILLIWVAGMVVVTALTIVQVILLRKKVRFAINTEDNIWETDKIGTAFVMGIGRVKIFLPTNISLEEREYILCHERMHIKHGDHIIRIIMLLVNIVYWWNPFVWLATYFMKKDIEMFCDESVVRQFDANRQKAYLKTLIHCSARSSGIIPVMSFGETNTELRIRHITNLKKPKAYIGIIISAFIIVVLGGCTFVAKNKVVTNDNQNNESTEETTTVNEETESSSKEESTTEHTLIYTPMYGIYIPVGDNQDRFIEMDSSQIILWDKTQFDNGKEPSHYLNSTDYGYYEKYSYECVSNTIELYKDTYKPELEFTLTIIDERTLQYNGDTYVYGRDALYGSPDTYKLNQTGYPLYDEVINKLVQLRIIQDKHSYDDYMSHDLSYAWGQGYFYNGGFYLTDLDGDGTPELFLGENGSGAWAGTIYDIYTIKNGELIKLCTGGHRDRFELCLGNVISEDGSSGASNSVYGYYKLIGNELVLQTGVVYESGINGENAQNPWFLCNETLLAETGTNISEEEAKAIINSYTSIPIEFTLFCEPKF